MKQLTLMSLVALILGLASTAMAQDDCRTFDPQRGECSPGTQAPSSEALLSVVERGTAQRLMAALEYGQRQECYLCVRPLMNRVLEDDNAQVREFGAWWLRQRVFAANMAFAFFKNVLQTDANPVRRARAAEALGEFLTASALVPLRTAVSSDSDALVRLAAVRGLGRLNHADSPAAIALAMSDAAADVRLAAAKQVNLVNAFREHSALLGLLTDADARVRREAALQAGQLRIADAVPALAALLRGDADAAVRRSAAWSLGMIGGTDAQTALAEAAGLESDSVVMDAIEVAQQMR